eukprot:COSAG06_NODE_3628_length_5098_cov_6.095619_1_plen_63_part_00
MLHDHYPDRIERHDRNAFPHRIAKRWIRMELSLHRRIRYGELAYASPATARRTVLFTLASWL